MRLAWTVIRIIFSFAALCPPNLPHLSHCSWFERTANCSSRSEHVVSNSAQISSLRPQSPLVDSRARRSRAVNRRGKRLSKVGLVSGQFSGPVSARTPAPSTAQPAVCRVGQRRFFWRKCVLGEDEIRLRGGGNGWWGLIKPGRDPFPQQEMLPLVMDVSETLRIAGARAKPTSYADFDKLW